MAEDWSYYLVQSHAKAKPVTSTEPEEPAHPQDGRTAPEGR